MTAIHAASCSRITNPYSLLNIPVAKLVNFTLPEKVNLRLKRAQKLLKDLYLIGAKSPYSNLIGSQALPVNEQRPHFPDLPVSRNRSLLLVIMSYYKTLQIYNKFEKLLIK